MDTRADKSEWYANEFMATRPQVYWDTPAPKRVARKPRKPRLTLGQHLMAAVTTGVALVVCEVIYRLGV
jgi:hypothetical protein